MPPEARTVVWFHCFAGIAGDMALAALLDAGADIDEVRAIVSRIPISGWTLDAEATSRNGIAATRIVIEAEPTTVVRTHAHVSALLEEARLPRRVLARAAATFEAIAGVEARLHRRPIEQVHYHELGGIDTIVDVVGVAAALEILGVDRVTASAVTTGTGVVRTAHGVLPNPSPAVVELLAAAGAPVIGVDLPVELTTPTGAGLLAALAEGWGPMPPMTVAATGFGAGTRELDSLPNMTQAVLGPEAGALPPSQPVVLLETNVDDVTGETLSAAITSLIDAGAADAWVTPIVMKKGRPAHTVSVLADPALAASLGRLLVAETGSLGVRGTTIERWPQARSDDSIEVEGLIVRVKVSPGRVKVEHDDALRVARRTGLPVREVVARAEAAWRMGVEEDAAATVVELPPPDEGPTDDAS